MKEIIRILAQEQGVEPFTLRQWKSRGFVPHKYRLPFILAAQKRGEKLAPKDLEFGKRPRRPEAA